MNQISDFVTSLNWADNWLSYLLTATLVVWLTIFTIRLILNKIVYVVKRIFYLGLIAVIGSLLSYALFLAGIIELDLLSLIGFSDLSNSIVQFFESISGWFRDTFLM
jgi:hypothetical protein